MVVLLLAFWNDINTNFNPNSHSIVGQTDLLISSSDGVISTQFADTFDYERQTQVLVQIQATDTLQTYEGEKLNR